MGFAHHGTCSLEKYMKDKGMDVVRVENGYKLPKYIKKVKDFDQRQQIYIRDYSKSAEYSYTDITTFNTILDLDDMKLNPNFLWLNKNDCLSIR